MKAYEKFCKIYLNHLLSMLAIYMERGWKLPKDLVRRAEIIQSEIEHTGAYTDEDILWAWKYTHGMI